MIRIVDDILIAICNDRGEDDPAIQLTDDYHNESPEKK